MTNTNTKEQGMSYMEACLNTASQEFPYVRLQYDKYGRLSDTERFTPQSILTQALRNATNPAGRLLIYRIADRLLNPYAR
jgi:hypothetical protein